MIPILSKVRKDVNYLVKVSNTENKEVSDKCIIGKNVLVQISA